MSIYIYIYLHQYTYIYMSIYNIYIYIMFLSMTSQLYNSLGEAPLVSQVKMWHRFLTAIPPSDDRRREVHHAVAQSAAETSDEAFAQYLL